jgi:hypothetical protein
MKILSRILSVGIALISFHLFAYAAECRPFDESRDCISLEDTDEQMSGYSNIGTYVYYGYCRIECADAGTFKPVKLKNEDSAIFGKDKNHVFFRVSALEGVSPNSYKIKETGNSDYYLIYDKNTVYLNTILFPQIDPNTFEFLDTSHEDNVSWFKDKNHVYRLIQADSALEDKLEILPNSDPSLFTFGYNITPDAVYWYGKKIDGVDMGSFELLHDGYAKDKNNVYNEGKIMYGADAESFHEADIKGIDIFIYIDKYKSYYGINSSIQELKKEKQNSINSIDQSISTAIKTYETKYPNYAPQPAVPAPGSPEEAELKKFQEEIAKAQQEEADANRQDMMKKGVLAIGILALGSIGYGVIRKRKKGKR